LGESIVKNMSLRRTAVATTLSGALMLLAAAPAHAEYVCWMSDGIRYCYDPNDSQLPAEPPPAPVEEPTFSPTPPAPTVEQPWIQPVPAAPAPVQPGSAPANGGPVHPVPVPAHAPPVSSGYHAPAVGAPVITAEVPLQHVPEAPAVSTDVPPAEASAPVPATVEVPSGSASPTATASPSTSATVVAGLASGQASSAAPFATLPLAFGAAGVSIVCAAAWFVVRRRRKLTGVEPAGRTFD
jgi:hypothetical protein